MGRIASILLLCLVFVPQSSQAIQLHWNSGGTDKAFTDATRCTLLVRADAAETRLPTQWSLLWVADSCAVSPVPIAAPATCPQDVAEVTSVTDPTSLADVAANKVTAQFCSSGSGPASTALFVLDLPGGKKGGFEVVALDPTDPDSSRVIRSGVATFNGGVSTPFPPVILRATTVHQSTEFQLHAVGAGLTQARDLTLAAADGSWQVPLNITNQGETSITASASLAANVPACVIQAERDGSAIATAPVPADPPPPTLAPQSACTRFFEEAYAGHAPDLIQPKDFAFVPGGWTPAGSWTFHFFYIRHNQYLAGPNTEKNIGHAVSNDLANWTVLDTMAIKVRSGMFDSQHVWAPSIVRKGLTYYMFYTGADDAGNQRMGLATSTDLVTWTQGNSILSASALGSWVDPTPAAYGGQAQLRDPFVMEDPNVPGNWLMYFVTVWSPHTPDMVVGVAQSSGDFTAWANSFPLQNTYHHWRAGTYIAESPHVFYRNGNWWLFSTVNGDTVWAESNAFSPTDIVNSGARWTPAQKLTTLVPVDQGNAFFYWHASEYLQISAANDIEYLAGYDDAQPSIIYTQMRPASPPYLFSMDCPSVAGVDETAASVKTLRLLLTGVRPARSHVSMRIELPARARVHLAVYDILGRRMETLVDGDLPAGPTELSWDGRDRSGAVAGSGVYFATLTAAGTRRTVRVPLLR